MYTHKQVPLSERSDLQAKIVGSVIRDYLQQSDKLKHAGLANDAFLHHSKIKNEKLVSQMTHLQVLVQLWRSLTAVENESSTTVDGALQMPPSSDVVHKAVEYFRSHKESGDITEGWGIFAGLVILETTAAKFKKDCAMDAQSIAELGMTQQAIAAVPATLRFGTVKEMEVVAFVKAWKPVLRRSHVCLSSLSARFKRLHAAECQSISQKIAEVLDECKHTYTTMFWQMLCSALPDQFCSTSAAHDSSESNGLLHPPVNAAEIVEKLKAPEFTFFLNIDAIKDLFVVETDRDCLVEMLRLRKEVVDSCVAVLPALAGNNQDPKFWENMRKHLPCLRSLQEAIEDDVPQRASYFGDAYSPPEALGHFLRSAQETLEKSRRDLLTGICTPYAEFLSQLIVENKTCSTASREIACMTGSTARSAGDLSKDKTMLDALKNFNFEDVIISETLKVPFVIVAAVPNLLRSLAQKSPCRHVDVDM